jgi:hypothetical protein
MLYNSCFVYLNFNVWSSNNDIFRHLWHRIWYNLLYTVTCCDQSLFMSVLAALPSNDTSNLFDAACWVWIKHWQLICINTILVTSDKKNYQLPSSSIMCNMRGDIRVGRELYMSFRITTTTNCVSVEKNNASGFDW